MLTIVPAESVGDIATARELLREYQALLGVDLCFQGFDAEVDGLPGEYAPPYGRLLLAAHDGDVVGVVEGSRGAIEGGIVKIPLR